MWKNKENGDKDITNSMHYHFNKEALFEIC